MHGADPFGLTTPDGMQPTVAIVAGNASMALVTLTLVEQFGCRPVKAAGGEAILALLRREPGIDLVLIDLPLLDLDGIAVAQLIRALGPHRATPVIALVDDRMDLTGRDQAAGFAAMVRKPFSPRELYAAVAASLTHATAARVLS